MPEQGIPIPVNNNSCLDHSLSVLHNRIARDIDQCICDTTVQLLIRIRDLLRGLNVVRMPKPRSVGRVATYLITFPANRQKVILNCRATNFPTYKMVDRE